MSADARSILPLAHPTAKRLALWRKYPYRDSSPLPPVWFGRVGSMSVDRESGTAHYGEGIGSDPKAFRPFRFRGFGFDILPRERAYPGVYRVDEISDMYFVGVVFQIPARCGKPQYLAGAEWGEGDPYRGRFSSGGGSIDISRGAVCDSEEEAAKVADGMAKSAAEREAEYQESERERIAAEEEEEEEEEGEEEEECSLSGND